MFNYEKTIQKHLDVLQKYEDPHALEEHMKALYKAYKVYLATMFLCCFSGMFWPNDSYAVFSILFSAMCFALAIQAWIDLQNLVMYKFLRDKCVGTQNMENSTKE